MNPIRIIQINPISKQKIRTFMIQLALLAGLLVWLHAIIPLLLLMIFIAVFYNRLQQQNTHSVLFDENKRMFLYFPHQGWSPAYALFACRWWMVCRAGGKNLVFFRDQMQKEDHVYCLVWFYAHGASTVGKGQGKAKG